MNKHLRRMSRGMLYLGLGLAGAGAVFLLLLKTGLIGAVVVGAVAFLVISYGLGESLES